jgi:hypothetical protein
MPLCEGRNQKLGGNAVFVWQRVEDNAFHLSKVDRLLRKMPVPARTDGKGPRRKRKINIRKLRLADRKENSAERLARPG